SADPQNVEAHTYLGVLADQSGNLKDAERHFATAARLDPKSPSARNNYGAILLRLERTREAAAEFEASLKLDSNQSKALFNLAQIRFGSNTPEGLHQAAELFKRADALAPDAEIARALTVITLRRNDRTQAADYYRTYAARAATASGGVTDSTARAELGGALMEAGLLSEAEAELKAALALDSTNADAVVRLARVYLAQKDIPAAGRTLEAAIARKVEAASIYSLLAVVYEKSNHFENAIPAMRLAIQLDPQSEKYRIQYALLLTNADAPAAAVIRLDEALKQFPKSARLWFARGLAHSRQSKNDEAASDFERAIQLDPNFAPAHAYLGVAHVELGRYDEGIAHYERALKADGKLAVVHYLIADTMSKQTSADETKIEARLKSAVELDPTFAPARLALAKTFNRQSKFAEAAAELEQVAKLDPGLAETYYQLGRAYGRLKRPQEAREALAKFKNLSDTQKQQEQNERREVVRRLADVLF
ncbi:MAG TPA: tetratricopeptide repeat protein, partial [Pyrinomonadaceae bacterium]|nr:tetratricopeptide repeat protein [Pyrinomonadaceae bacterium]